MKNVETYGARLGGTAWRALLGLACASMVLFMGACGSSDNGEKSSNDSDKKEYRIGVVLQTFTVPSIQDIANGMTSEAKNHPNVDLRVQDSQSLQEQVSKARTMIAQGVDALGIEPLHGEAIFPVLQEAKNAGIPVFLVQDGAPGAVEQGLAVTYIASDERKGGELVGQVIRKALDDKGKVAILEGAAGDAPAIERTEGFKTALEGSGVKVVASSPGDWTRDKGLSVANDMLTAHSDLDAIFAENDDMAFGALSAISAAKRKGDIMLAGYNGSCSGLEATLKGDFQLEGVLFLEDVGRKFVELAVAHLDGEKISPREVLPIAALTTDQLKDVLDGKETDGLEADIAEELRPRLEEASKGSC